MRAPTPVSIEEVARPLLEQAGADAALDIVAAAVLQDDGFDAREVQEMRQHQPGRPGPDDSDLRAHCTSTPGINALSERNFTDR